MPQTIVTETVVYTLSELKELDPSAYQDALGNVKEWSWECFEPSIFTGDLKMWIAEDYKSFDLDEHTLEWDMDQMWIHAKGHVSVQDFLIEHRLRNKYRLLWSVLKANDIHFDIECSFGYGRNRRGDNGYANCGEFQGELDWVDGIADDQARYSKMVAQVDALEKEIEGWMSQIHDRLRETMRAERDGRWEDEYAIEEADALELKFTEEGEIFHG